MEANFFQMFRYQPQLRHFLPLLREIYTSKVELKQVKIKWYGHKKQTLEIRGELSKCPGRTAMWRVLPFKRCFDDCKCLGLTLPHTVNLRGWKGNSIKFVDNSYCL